MEPRIPPQPHRVATLVLDRPAVPVAPEVPRSPAVARCRAAGMDDHLGKPINLPRLLEALAQWSAARDDEATGAARSTSPA